MNYLGILILTILLAGCSGKIQDPVEGTVTVAGLSAGGQNGGILLAGINVQETHSFIREVSSSQSLVLEKGVWRFIGIAWEGESGLGNMTGTNRCAVIDLVELEPPSTTIALNFSAANCNTTLLSSLAKEVLGTSFQPANGSQFKKLSLTVCEDIDRSGIGCLSGGTDSSIQSQSFQVSLQQEAEILNSSEVIGSFTSRCFNLTNQTTHKSSDSEIKLPSSITQNDLVYKPTILLHDSSDCSDTDPIRYKLEDGLIAHNDQLNGNSTLVSDLVILTGDETLDLYLEQNGLTTNNTPQSSASSLSFSEGLATSSSTLTATWTSSNSSFVASEEVQLFSDSSCSASIGGITSYATSSSQPLSHAFSSLTEGTYYFMVSTFNSASQIISESACSQASSVDQTAPASPSSSSLSDPNLQWIVSGSADVVKQTIQFYTGGGCAGPVGISHDIFDNTTASIDKTIFGLGSGNYYFGIRTEDQAGNVSTQECSAVSFNIP